MQQVAYTVLVACSKLVRMCTYHFENIGIHTLESIKIREKLNANSSMLLCDTQQNSG
jgi:hypothetical protein